MLDFILLEFVYKLSLIFGSNISLLDQVRDKAANDGRNILLEVFLLLGLALYRGLHFGQGIKEGDVVIEVARLLCVFDKLLHVNIINVYVDWVIFPFFHCHQYIIYHHSQFQHFLSLVPVERKAGFYECAPREKGGFLSDA